MGKNHVVRTPIPVDEQEQYEELVAFIKQTDCLEKSLIAILHKTQNLFGYVPETAMLIIGEFLDLPVSTIYGVVTFYSYFTLKPKGKYACSVCLGTACYVKGAQDVLQALEDELEIKAGDTTDDRLFSIVPTRCLGDCSRAPIVMVNNDLHGDVSPESVRKLVRHYRKQEQAAQQAVSEEA